MDVKLYQAGMQRPLIFDSVALHDEWRLIGNTVALGIGCAFGTTGLSAHMPPSVFVSVLVLASLAGVIGQLWSRFWVQAGLSTLAGLALGAQASASLSGAELTREAFSHISASVERVEWRFERPVRLTVRPDDPRYPFLVSLTVRTSIPEDLTVGDKVELDAFLSPLNGPITPEGFDFSRKARFEGKGALGIAASAVTVTEHATPATFGGRLDRLRASIAADIMKAMPGQAGALVVALGVGIRDYISPSTAEALRRAGLSHLLAISGLHMGLVTASAFFLLEYMFAAIPLLALRVRPQKLAAWGGWFAAIIYLALSGASIATIRAFIMVTVALLAVLLDRKVLSLRSVCLAAIIILIFQPYAVHDIGFQMSFAATSALVAVYEHSGSIKFLKERGRGPVARLVLFIMAASVTSMIAQIAVAPFALYHFQAVSIIGVAANIAVLPLMSILVMPLIMIGFLLYSFGLMFLVTPLLQFLLDQVLALAHTFGDASYAVYRVSQPDSAFLIAAAIAFVGFLTFRGRWITAPALLAIAALWLLGNPHTASILVDNGGKVIATHRTDNDNDRMAISGGRRNSYRDRAWQQYWGLDPDQKPDRLKTMCDSGACRTRLDGLHVTRADTLGAVRHACASGDVVIATWRWRRYCRGAAIYISAEDIEKKGPAGIFIGKTGDAEVRWSRE